MKIFLILFCFVLSSCAQRCSNETAPILAVQLAVRKFVEISVSAKSLEDRKRLQDLSIGELKRAFEQITEDDFRTHYLGEKIVLKDLQLGVPEFEGDRARLRYTVRVLNTQGKSATEETNEREAVLSVLRGEWLIDTIRPVGSDRLAFSEGMIF